MDGFAPAEAVPETAMIYANYLKPHRMASRPQVTQEPLDG